MTDQEITTWRNAAKRNIEYTLESVVENIAKSKKDAVNVMSNYFLGHAGYIHSPAYKNKHLSQEPLNTYSGYMAYVQELLESEKYKNSCGNNK